jgi:hypothetical protein
MTHQKLGQSDDARARLQKADEFLEHAYPAATNWDDHIELRLLHKEAKGLVDSK